jgi:putative addiction module CopG family antidote
MNVSLSERNVERIQSKVASGRYSSVDDVLDSALSLLDERDQALERELAEMHESVRRGTEQADAGQVVPASEVFAGLRQRSAAIIERST